MHVVETANAIVDSDSISTNMYSYQAGVRLLEELQSTYRAIIQTPTIGSLIDDLEESPFEKLRMCTVKKFRNYLVFYSVNDQEILIERILDGRRDFLDQFAAE